MQSNCTGQDSKITITAQRPSVTRLSHHCSSYAPTQSPRGGHSNPSDGCRLGCNDVDGCDEGDPEGEREGDREGFDDGLELGERDGLELGAWEGLDELVMASRHSQPQPQSPPGLHVNDKLVMLQSFGGIGPDREVFVTFTVVKFRRSASDAGRPPDKPLLF